MSELVEAGEFDSMLAPTAKRLPPQEDFKELLQSHPVLAVIEGTADQQSSQASKDLVALLKSHGINFTALNMEQRKDLHVLGLHVPSLYVQGQLIGDLSKLASLGAELPKHIPTGFVIESIEQRLHRLVNQKKVMVFMKGSPKQAACGFSQRMVNLLAQYPDIEYGSFDIFSDEAVREGLKKYSNWPTYPQVYVDGQLIGGIDIC